MNASSDSNSTADDGLLDALAEEFTLRFRRGENPVLEDYLAQAPSLATQLRSILETVVFLESTRRELNDDEEPLHRELLPTQLGEYHLMRELGRGGMGIVCLAKKPSARKHVAVKFLSPELQGQPLARKRFLREATLAMTVQHPHVVGIESVGEENAIPYLVMELVDGPTLREFLATQHPLPPELILRFALQLAQGVEAAHQQNVIHRDIKCANVLVSLSDPTTPDVKIADFGLARAREDATLTRTGHVIGTPQNMSPEQVNGQPIDHRSDLFSLGTVYYELCMGLPAFAGDSIISVVRQIADMSPPPIADRRQDLPVWLLELIDTLLAKNPDQRPSTAGDVCRWIESEGTQRGAHPSNVALNVDASALPKRNRWLATSLALIGILVVFAARAIWWRPAGVASPTLRTRAPATSSVIPGPSTKLTGNLALQFNGVETSVRIPRLRRPDTSPATLEAWVRTGNRSSAKIIALWGGLGRCQLSVSPDNWFCSDDAVEGRFLDTPCDVNGQLSPWVHLAYVADAEEGRFYFQGKVVARGKRSPERKAQFPNPPTWIGASPEPVLSATALHYHFLGMMDELRMSRGARYQGDFQPTDRWEPDEQTIALYHFDEGEGSLLRDSSGNGYDGEIQAPKWVSARR